MNIIGRDEGNIIAPYTSLGRREAEGLMFVSLHMASLASGALIIGYHQDVNLVAHILSMVGTYVPVTFWDKMATIVYDLLWKGRYTVQDEWKGDQADKYPTYDVWKESFVSRCIREEIEPYSGRGLYSTLLPEDMNWSMGKTSIRNGILVSGMLESRTTSGSNASVGVNIYRTYGPDMTVEWLNASYRMLNQYLIYRGITLGFPHILMTEKQAYEVNMIKQGIYNRKDLNMDVDTIPDPVIRIRMEAAISQELDNIREAISVIVMNPKDRDISLYIRGTVEDTLTLSSREKDLYLYKNPLDNLPVISRNDEEIVIQAQGAAINMDLYSGSIQLRLQGRSESIYLSMGIFPRVRFTLITKEIQASRELYLKTPIDREYTIPNQLKMMIESGARGNATNAIQISGIFGQISYMGGRIPRMLSTSQSASIAGLDQDDQLFKESTGPRSMPCFSFGENTPVSKGMIPESYLEGLGPESYMSAHVASRENLTSNTDLTPMTGYFMRRLRTFIENNKVDRIDGKQVVTNERGIVVMWDYILDPSKTFNIDRNSTFVDLGYERLHIKQATSTRAIYVRIPLLDTLDDYLSLDNRLQALLRTINGIDIYLICEDSLDIMYPDYYEYLVSVVTKDKKHLFVLSNVPTNWIFSLTEYMDGILVIPITSYVDTDKIQELVGTLNMTYTPNVSAKIDIARSSINAPSYKVQSGTPIPISTLYQMLTMGTEFAQYPYVIKPTKEFEEGYSLLESLILNGDIHQL